MPLMRAPMALRKLAKSADLGLHRGVADDRRAFRATGGQQQVLGAGVAGIIEVQARAAQARRLDDVAHLAVVAAGIDAAASASCTIRAPIAWKPRTSTLTGRMPMAQPPGWGAAARPRRARRGPTTRKDARMIVPRSRGTSSPVSSRAQTVTVCAFRRCSTSAPSARSTSSIVWMSSMSGRLRIVHGSSVSRQAARMGSPRVLRAADADRALQGMAAFDDDRPAAERAPRRGDDVSGSAHGIPRRCRRRTSCRRTSDRRNARRAASACSPPCVTGPAATPRRRWRALLGAAALRSRPRARPCRPTRAHGRGRPG